MIRDIENDVKFLMSGDNTGHGFEHIKRVFDLAVDIAKTENADIEVVGLAALLHDVDDYKLFGQESADDLTNARNIMDKYNINDVVKNKVYDIIAHMGYSNAMKGIRPNTLEGKIVSDADMLDAIGACGTIRCLTYALARCDTVVFDELVFPDINMSAEEYKKPNRKSDNFINHFFEKLLKLKYMMFTQSGKQEAEKRHKIMVDFLFAFFREQKLDNWLNYLQEFEKQNSIKEL